MNTQSEIDDFLSRIHKESESLELKYKKQLEQMKKPGGFSSIVTKHLECQVALLFWVLKIAKESGIRDSSSKVEPYV